MTNTDCARILVVDDHRIIRLAFRRLLAEIHCRTVAGEASSGEEALEMLSEAQFDLAIVDISMGGMDGIRLTEQIKKNHSDVQVLIVSLHDEGLYVRQALGVGADGYVLKSNIDSVIKEATGAVLSGQRYLCDDTRRLIDEKRNSME